VTKRLALLLLVLVGLLVALFFHRAPPWTIYRLERRLGLVWLLESRREKPREWDVPVESSVPLSTPDRKAIRHAARAWVWQQFRIKTKQGRWGDSGYLLGMVLRPAPDVRGLSQTCAVVLLRQDYHVRLTKNTGHWNVDFLHFYRRLDDGRSIQSTSSVLGFTSTNAAPLPYNLTIPPNADKPMRQGQRANP
jgi:hypothetical protein